MPIDQIDSISIIDNFSLKSALLPTPTYSSFHRALFLETNFLYEVTELENSKFLYHERSYEKINFLYESRIYAQLAVLDTWYTYLE